MESFEPKKLALIRIWQILKEYSDYDHPLTQDDIAQHLENDYGIVIERKAISRNISLLKEAGIDIESRRAGSYLEGRDFEDSELKLLIDGVLCSKHITAKHSKDLIDRLCGLSNKYFRSHVKNIYSVNDWSKTDNQALFFNIELIDTAIDQKLRVAYDYNKIGIDKKLHKSSYQVVSPYQLILHNQRYYLMAYSEYWGNMVFHRLDRITNMKLMEEKATDLQTIPGYKNGIDYKKLSSAMKLSSNPSWGINMTVDQALIYIPQLTKRCSKLWEMMNKLPKARETVLGYGRNNSVIDYRYVNYDIEKVENDYYKCKSELDRAQLQLDLVNSTVQLTVDELVVEG